MEQSYFAIFYFYLLTNYRTTMGKICCYSYPLIYHLQSNYHTSRNRSQYYLIQLKRKIEIELYLQIACLNFFYLQFLDSIVLSNTRAKVDEENKQIKNTNEKAKTVVILKLCEI